MFWGSGFMFRLYGSYNIYGVWLPEFWPQVLAETPIMSAWGGWGLERWGAGLGLGLRLDAAGMGRENIEALFVFVWRGLKFRV